MKEEEHWEDSSGEKESIALKIQSRHNCRDRRQNHQCNKCFLNRELQKQISAVSVSAEVELTGKTQLLQKGWRCGRNT